MEPRAWSAGECCASAFSNLRSGTGDHRSGARRRASIDPKLREIVSVEFKTFRPSSTNWSACRSPDSSAWACLPTGMLRMPMRASLTDLPCPLPRAQPPASRHDVHLRLRPGNRQHGKGPRDVGARQGPHGERPAEPAAQGLHVSPRHHRADGRNPFPDHFLPDWLHPRQASAAALRVAFPNQVLSTRDIGRAMLAVARNGSVKRILETADIRALLRPA